MCIRFNYYHYFGTSSVPGVPNVYAQYRSPTLVVVDWKALGYPAALFLVLLVVTLDTSSDALILTITFPCGLVAGYQAAGLLRGSLYGFAVGASISLFFLLSAYYLGAQGRVAPGFGATLFFIFLVGIFLTLQSTVAGFLGGGVARLVAYRREG